MGTGRTNRRRFLGFWIPWILAAPGFGATPFLESYRKAERMRSPEDRLEFFDRALELWRDSDGKTLLASCRLERGRAEAALDRYRPAVEDFSAALALDPLAVSVYLDRGLAYAALGKRREALQDIRQYAAAKPDDLSGLLARGDAYRELGRFKEANDDFIEAARRDPKEARAPLGIGRCLAEQGRCLEAVAYYDQALALSEAASSEVLYFRGVCWSDLGRLPRARADLDAAIAGFEQRLSDRERSARTPYRVREIRLKLGKVCFQRGKLRRREGDRDGAYEDFRRACGLGYDPACPPARELAPRTKPKPAPTPPKPKYKSKGDGPGDRYYGR